jgi:hypothetical protein
MKFTYKFVHVFKYWRFSNFENIQKLYRRFKIENWQEKTQYKKFFCQISGIRVTKEKKLLQALRSIEFNFWCWLGADSVKMTATPPEPLHTPTYSVSAREQIPVFEQVLNIATQQKIWQQEIQSVHLFRELKFSKNASKKCWKRQLICYKLAKVRWHFRFVTILTNLFCNSVIFVKWKDFCHFPCWIQHFKIKSVSSNWLSEDVRCCFMKKHILIFITSNLFNRFRALKTDVFFLFWFHRKVTDSNLLFLKIV